MVGTNIQNKGIIDFDMVKQPWKICNDPYGVWIYLSERYIWIKARNLE